MAGTATTPARQGDQSLDRIVERFEREGFEGQFASRGVDSVLCLSCRKEPSASEVSMLKYERYEGTSAPDEEAVVVGLECPGCKKKGTLVLTYGTEAPAEDAAIFAALKDQRKR